MVKLQEFWYVQHAITKISALLTEMIQQLGIDGLS